MVTRRNVLNNLLKTFGGAISLSLFPWSTLLNSDLPKVLQSIKLSPSKTDKVMVVLFSTEKAENFSSFSVSQYESRERFSKSLEQLENQGIVISKGSKVFKSMGKFYYSYFFEFSDSPHLLKFYNGFQESQKSKSNREKFGINRTTCCLEDSSRLNTLA